MIRLKQQKRLPFGQRPRPRREENTTKKWQSPSGHKEKSLHGHHIPTYLNMKIIMNMMQGCPTQCQLMTRCQTWLADHARWGYIAIAFPVNDQCLTQTQWDYILQFVDRIDSLLDALLSQEDLPNEHLTCSHCKMVSDCRGVIWRIGFNRWGKLRHEVRGAKMIL